MDYQRSINAPNKPAPDRAKLERSLVRNLRKASPFGQKFILLAAEMVKEFRSDPSQAAKNSN